MVDQIAYPVLFGTTQASWAPIDLRFELFTGDADPSRIARVFVVPSSMPPAWSSGSSMATGGQWAAVVNQARASGPPWSASWPEEEGPERTVAVLVLAPDAAVSLLAAKGRADVKGAGAREWAPMGSTRMKIEERIDVEALLKSIGSLQDLQFRQRGLEPAMQQIVDAAKTLFKADGAGLMLIGEGEVLRWVTATDPRAQVIEAAQERLGEGPCVEAFERGTLQLILDTGSEERWPDLTRVLRHDGVHAVLSVPVQVAQGTVGSLNFYLAEPHEWDHSERNAAEVYGRLAGALLGSALTAELQGRLIEQLQWALDHRILIEQAKGVLMGREGVSADVAYQRMRSAARSSRRPVAEVAQIVVDGGPWGLPRKDS